jgi:hypothetical protein
MTTTTLIINLIILVAILATLIITQNPLALFAICLLRDDSTHDSHVFDAESTDASAGDASAGDASAGYCDTKAGFITK